MENVLNRKEATPVLIVAVGHNHNIGEVTVLTTEETSDQDIKLFLAAALKQIMEK